MISPARSFYGWSNVGLLFVIYLSAMGMVFYGFSVIFPSMVQEMGWGRGEAAFAHTLRALLLGFTAPLVALALQKFGGRNTIAVGLSLLCLGSVLLAGCGESDWVGRDASDGRRAEQGEGSPFPVRTGSVSHG